MKSKPLNCSEKFPILCNKYAVLHKKVCFLCNRMHKLNKKWFYGNLTSGITNSPSFRTKSF